MKNEWRHADIRPEAGCTRGTDSGRTAGGRPENPVNIPETDLSWRIASVSGRLRELGKTPELPDPWGHFFAVLSDVFLSGGSEEGFLAFSACRNLFGRTAGEAACVLALLARQAADFHRAGTPEGETAWCDLCEMAVFLHGELAGGIPAGRLREEIAAFAADCLTEIAAALVRPDVIRRPAHTGGITHMYWMRSMSACTNTRLRKHFHPAVSVQVGRRCFPASSGRRRMPRTPGCSRPAHRGSCSASWLGK